MYTFNWGKDGEYKDCNGSPVPFENLCRIDDDDNSIDTPMGYALFVPDKDECRSGNCKGILLGRDGNTFLCECERDDHQFNEWVGFS